MSKLPMDHFKFFGSATIGTKGQIVIPAEARESLGFKEGDKVIVLNAPHGDGIMVLKTEIFEEMIGHMQTKLTSFAKSIKNTKEDN